MLSWMFSRAGDEVLCLPSFRIGLSVLMVTHTHARIRPSQGAPDVAQSPVHRLPKLTLM